VTRENNRPLKKVGDPISQNEFLDHYSLLIRHILEQLTFADWENPQIIETFETEMFRAETQWSRFVEVNGRPPDYEFLQKEIITFGIERLSLFEGSSNLLSADNFVYSHIEQLKIENLLSGRFFKSRDVAYIESYERNKAYHYFHKRDRYVLGYEAYRISINETMQHAGYRQLRNTFLDDPLVKMHLK